MDSPYIILLKHYKRLHTIAMARCSKLDVMCGGVAAAVVAMMLGVFVVCARPVKLEPSNCCSTADEYAYPYWSFCNHPAELCRGYHYVQSAARLGGLEPEYENGNSTCYVRFTGSSTSYGAKYVAAVASGISSGSLTINSTVYIYNAKTKRALQWMQEGTNEYFLIEQEVSSITEGAPFRFLKAEGTHLRCPRIYPQAQCSAYYLVSDPDSHTCTGAGLLAYKEEGVTYVKAAPTGSMGNLAVVLVKSSYSSTSAMPFPTLSQ